jgi:DNA repair exonuclease SbcCD ATPase subunit
MIPEELHLRNFLSHQETNLELRGVHLASLVGENGAGKSSLLDAITWATWGRSRTPYGREENLIQHGETWGEVEYVFRMPYQGNVEHRCRILRRKETQSRRAAASLLDFQIQTEEGWRSLNGNSIRETQTRIVDELGLDYDTFANSAYLRQGHADEFTLQTSSERKRVLGTILGLERWEGYQELAKRRLALVQGQVQELERHLVDLKKELEQRPEVEASLEQAEALAQEAGARLLEVQEQVNELTRLQDQARAAGTDQRVGRAGTAGNAAAGGVGAGGRKPPLAPRRLSGPHRAEPGDRGAPQGVSGRRRRRRSWSDKTEQTASCKRRKPTGIRSLHRPARRCASRSARWTRKVPHWSAP